MQNDYYYFFFFCTTGKQQPVTCRDKTNFAWCATQCVRTQNQEKKKVAWFLYAKVT
jgi:hypothetical protein